LRDKELGSTSERTPTWSVCLRLVTQTLQLLRQLSAAMFDDRVDAGGNNRLDLMPQFYPVRDAQYRSSPQPIGNVCPVDTADEFANPAVFFRSNFHANVTGGGIAGDFSRIVYEMDEHLSRCQGVLYCCQPPSVKIAQMMDVMFRMMLKAGRLILLQKTAEGASGFLKHVQDRLIKNELFLCSHQRISAITEPPHTTASPRMRLLIA